MVDIKENYKLDLGVQRWNEEIYDIFFMFSQKVSLTKKKNNKKPTSPDLVDETGTTLFPFFFLASLLISYKPKWNDIKKSKTGTQSSQSSQRILHSQISLVWKYHTSEECISCALIHLLRSNQYYSLPSRQRDKINFQPFFIIILTEIN